MCKLLNNNNKNILFNIIIGIIEIPNNSLDVE